MDQYKWLLTIDELANLLGIENEDVWLSVAEGVMPSPVSLHNNGPRLWSRFQVLRWLEAGCPIIDDDRAVRAETEQLAAAYESEHGPLPENFDPRLLRSLEEGTGL